MKVKLLTDAVFVNCEKAERVKVSAGVHDAVSVESARNDQVIVVLHDPSITYLGGDDGKTEVVCTLRAQLPADKIATV